MLSILFDYIVYNKNAKSFLQTGWPKARKDAYKSGRR